jgi:hypothetical protein
MLLYACQLAGPLCATFCCGMGASVRANSATKGSPSVSVLGIAKAATIRTQPTTRRPSARPPRHASSPAAYTTLPRLTAAPIVQPSTSGWSSPPKLQAEHGDPESGYRGVQHAGGQPYPLLARLIKPEDPRPTSTAARASSSGYLAATATC